MTLPIFRRYGVTIGLYASDPSYDFEIERAPDLGGVPHSDPTEREIIGPIPGTRETFTDIQPPDGLYRHYRIRHAKEGEEPSPWTCWVRGLPEEVPLAIIRRPDPVLPVIREAILSSGGQWQAELTINDPQCRVVEVAFDVGSGYVPAEPAGSVYTSPSVGMATRIRARVTGYDAAGRLVVLMERDYGEGGGMPPISTTYLVRSIAPDRLRVWLRAVPEGGTVHYRLDGGPWEAAAGAVSFEVDVSRAPVLLEFHSTLGALKEDTRQIYLDEDDDPNIYNISARAHPSDHITVTVVLDDDAVSWRLWAKRESPPLIPGALIPDDDYLRDEKDASDTTAVFAARPGLWYLYMRAIGPQGQYRDYGPIEVEVTEIVPPEPGELSNIAVSPVTVGGLRYHELVWDHNAAAGDGSHRVVILQDGATVVSLSDDRDVRTDADGTTPGELGTGGYRRRVDWVEGSTPGARTRSWSYQVQLFSGGHLVGAYRRTITGFIQGDDPPPPKPPSTAPTNLQLSIGPWDGDSEVYPVTVTWTNTNSTAPITIEHIRMLSQGTTMSGVIDVPAGSTSAMLFVPPSVSPGPGPIDPDRPDLLDTLSVHAAYRTSEGTGPWASSEIVPIPTAPSP